MISPEETMLAKILTFLPMILSLLHKTTAPTVPAPAQPGQPPAKLPDPQAHPTYLAVAGLVGLGIYLFSQGDTAGAIQQILTGLALAGVLHGTPGAGSTPPAPPTAPTTPTA